MLKPSEVFADDEADSLTFDEDVKIVAIQDTIGSFPPYMPKSGSTWTATSLASKIAVLEAPPIST